MTWKHAVGKYPRNWDAIKRSVIERDRNRCAHCHKKDHEPRNGWFPPDETISRRFRVHHKDGDKANNDLSNLVYLCANCHGKEHAKLNTEAKSEVV